MSPQAVRNPPNLGLPTVQSSSQQKNPPGQERHEGATPWGESPELLRLRADMLMDEMMLGAIDVYAGEPNPVAFAATPSSPTPPVGQPSQVDHERASVKLPVNTSGQNGTQHKLDALPTNGHRAATAYSATPAETVAPRKTEPAPPPAASSTQPAREAKSWVFSAEARYQQIARGQQSNAADPGQSQAFAAPDAHFTSTVALPQPAQPWMPTEVNPPAANPLSEERQRNGQGGYGQNGYRQNSQEQNGHGPGQNGHSTQGYTPSTGTREPELGPVRRTVAQVTSAMAIPAQGGAAYGGANRNGKWTNLLPRMSNTDLQTLQQEITTLHSEINAVLPKGHESNQRVQHLLEKAQTILENDPTRSAEVEYYLQQVRTIFQRVQQTIHWSKLYRNRLLVYLTSWLLLAVIVIVARYLYQTQMENLMGDLAHWADDSFAFQNFATWLNTLCCGALGGAVGALINLRLRSRLAHGFFDRKYGLRGLMLPVMGALFGLLLYLPISALYYMLELNPSTSLVLSLIPGLLAFAFGVSQESIYGTRG